MGEERGGEERVDEGELLMELGEWRDCLVGMVLGEELCLSSGCFPWLALDFFWPDGDRATLATR